MKIINLFKFLLLTGTVLSYSGENIDQDILGEVIYVKDNMVQIKTSKIKKVNIGNQINLYYETAFGDKVEYGTWIVSKVDKNTIKAKPSRVITEPIVGLSAKIKKVSKRIYVDTKRNHINPWSINKDISGDSQQYTDQARKIAKDLYSNAKNYSKSKIKDLQNKTLENIQKAISMNNAEAYFLLSFIVYEDGFGDIKRDFKKMVDNLTLSAEKGYLEAQYMLGEMYKDGDEVVKDLEEAIYWLKKAAERGHKDAKYELEMLMEDKDKKESENNNAIDDLYDLLD